jgi:ABC-2 type transport system permease protein
MNSLPYPLITKEIKSYCASPALYLVAAAFLTIAGYLFYGNLLMLLMFQGSGIAVNLWEYTVNDIRLLVMLLVPYVTMRSFAEEKKQGTLELLYTAPVPDRAILVGKFTAALAMMVLIISCTLAYPFLFDMFYPLDWGPLASAYAGLVLLAMALVALGIFISSLTEHQIIAAGMTMGISFLLWFMRGGAETTGFFSFAPGLASLQKHFFGFNRGVVATQDVLFFILLTLAFLLLTWAWMQQRGAEQSVLRIRWLPAVKIPAARFCIAAIMIAAIFATVMAAATRWNLRFDLTPDKAFTLSRVTADALAMLGEKFKLTVACSNESMYQYEDFLQRFRQESRHFTYRLMQIDKNPVAAQYARLNEHGAGIAEYKDKTAYIPKIDEASIVQGIYDLMPEDTKTIRIYGDDVDGSPGQEKYLASDEDLRQQGYRLITSSLQNSGRIPQDTRLVIARTRQGDIPALALEALGNYCDDGGNLLLLLSGDGAMPATRAFLKRYNIELGDDRIIDSGNPAFDFDPLMQAIYPNKAHPAFTGDVVPGVFHRVRSVQVGTEFAGGHAWTILCQSGRNTWAETDPDGIAQNKAAFDEEKDIYGPVAAGVTVERKQDGGDNSHGRGRLAVIGASSFIEEQYYAMLGNADLYRRTVAWLAERQVLPVALHQPPAQKMQAYVGMTTLQDSMFFWILVVAEPLLVLLTGIGVSVLRRIWH